MPRKDGMRWIVCKQCGKRFLGQKGRVYCSDECKEQWKREHQKIKPQKTIYTKTCDHCGSEFTTELQGQRFCSDKCRIKYYSDRAPRKGKKEYTCEYCGKTFWSTNPRVRFCPEHAGMDVVSCAECGKPVLVYTRYDGSRFCSEECREKNRLRKLRASVSANVARRYPNCDFDADSYHKAEDPVRLKCKVCGHEFNISYEIIKPSRAGEGQGCPKCRERELEEKRRQEREAIAKRLEQKELIKYLKQENERLRKIAKEGEVKECLNCGKEFVRCKSKYENFCSDLCRTRYNNRSHDRKRRHRIKVNGNHDNSITLEKLYKRHNGVCQICGTVCDWEDKTEADGTIITGNTYPSIDHITPLSKGGQHTWENVQLLCRGCNSRKSDSLGYTPHKKSQISPNPDRGPYIERLGGRKTI